MHEHKKIKGQSSLQPIYTRRVEVGGYTNAYGSKGVVLFSCLGNENKNDQLFP